MDEANMGGDFGDRCLFADSVRVCRYQIFNRKILILTNGAYELQMAEPTQFHQLSEKLDDIKDLVTRLELKLEERDGLIRERLNAEIATIRKEFTDYKTFVAEKITANTVKTGAIFTLLMAALAALIAKLMQ